MTKKNSPLRGSSFRQVRESNEQERDEEASEAVPREQIDVTNIDTTADVEVIEHLTHFLTNLNKNVQLEETSLLSVDDAKHAVKTLTAALEKIKQQEKIAKSLKQLLSASFER